MVIKRRENPPIVLGVALDELKADARRYRWLRDNFKWTCLQQVDNGQLSHQALIIFAADDEDLGTAIDLILEDN